MLWALDKNDPEDWQIMPTIGNDLIAQADGPFKDALDKTKYASHYPEEDMSKSRQKAADFFVYAGPNAERKLSLWIKSYISRYGYPTFCSAICF